MARLTPDASRAARAILQWSMRDLAAKAGVSLSTVAQVEGGGDFYASTSDKIVGAFRAAGVEILDDDAPGARRRRPSEA